MKKLELNPNEKKILELRSEQPKIGKSTYGDYYLYIVSNGSGEECSFFAPNEKVHEILKNLRRGSRFEIIKTAQKKNGKEVLVDYEVSILEEKKTELGIVKDNYFTTMLNSFEDAIKIQEKMNGMCDVNKIATTLFIARSKLNGNW